MRIGVVLVHYRTPLLVQEAVRALLCSEGLGSTELDLVIVDNGSDQAGRAVLRSVQASYGVRLVTPRGNLGYAGGVNLGFSQLSTGKPLRRGPDVLIAMNPDVAVGPRCLSELVRALNEGAGVAGPRFAWGEGDDENTVLMPPADAVGRGQELGRYLAESRGGHWSRRARAVWRRHAQRHWTATSDLDSYSLSGALLAISAVAWNRVGTLDEGYRLYFEETDWLRRAAKLGIPSRYVPGAIAYHGYARSTPQEPRAASWFADSERRFRRRWYGRAFATLLRSLARRRPPRPAEVDDGAQGTPRLDAEVRWIEISASQLGLPAGGIHLPVGCDPDTDPMPEVVRTRSREMDLYWRTLDAAGRESASRKVETSGEH